MTKHYELYQPRFVKQLAKMKGHLAHFTVKFRRLSEENDLLKVQLLAAQSEINQFRAMKTDDPTPEPTQLPQPTEPPADELNPQRGRLLTYVRSAIGKLIRGS